MKKSLGARTIIYAAPVLAVGTYDDEGKPNVMTASWAGICCSRPPALTVSIREATYTYGNIMHRKAFTASIPSEDYVKQVDYFGLASGKREHKFAAAGLTPVRSEVVDAPYVEEFPLVLECRLLKSVEIGSHTQFIGEILDIKAEETVLSEEGLPEIKKVRPFLYVPESRSYYGIGEYLAKAFSAGKEIGNRKRKVEL